MLLFIFPFVFLSHLAGRDNVIYGPFVVGHYSFFPQFKHMSTSPVLAEYRRLAAYLEAEDAGAHVEGE